MQLSGKLPILCSERFPHHPHLSKHVMLHVLQYVFLPKVDALEHTVGRLNISKIDRAGTLFSIE